jgi:hypothetical protein
MNAKLRRQLAAKIKSLGLQSKLYRGSKFLFYRRHNGRRMRELLEQLEMSTPGMLVEDCDYFNHVVQGFRPGETFQRHNRAWYDHVQHGYFFEFNQVVFEDGRWSCGCNAPGLRPPNTREEIERRYLEHFDGKDIETDIDSFTEKPYDGLTKSRVQTLLGGGHICDDRGILLPEFCRSFSKDG